MWTLNRDDSFTLLDSYSQIFEFPVIDTADSYVQWVDKSNGGESEEIIGEWMFIRENREKIFLCTKIGKKKNRQGLDSSNIIEATSESLFRLRVNYVDVLMLHTWSYGADVSEIVRALNQLYRNGLVRFFGVSNFPHQILKNLHEELMSTTGQGISFLQYHYNLIERDAYVQQFDKYSYDTNFGFESKILLWAEQNNVVTMPYHPLARGFLSEKYLNPLPSTTSIHLDRVMKYHKFSVMPLLLEMDRMAKQHETKIANIALAWLKSRGRHFLPTVSFSSVEQMVSLSTIPMLSDQELSLLTLISGEINRK